MLIRVIADVGSKLERAGENRLKGLGFDRKQIIFEKYD